MNRFLILLIVLCDVAVGAGKDAAITENELIRRTQELYDAVVPGNQAPWKKYFADDCIFADEKGRVFDKPKLIADITPLPAGYSGAIKFRTLRAGSLGISQYSVMTRTRRRRFSTKI